MSWFVYMLRCADNSLYCGVTTDLNRRVEAHSAGTGARYTRSRLPAHLAWFAQTQSKSDALKEEFRIKRLPKHGKELLVTSQRSSEDTRMAVKNSQGGIAMTKPEIVAKLAEDAKVTKKVAAAMLDSLVQTGVFHEGRFRGGNHLQ